MARYAISDIHGCLNTFKEALELIALTKEDTLYLLGDYVDRGPDSKGVIDYIWELQGEGFNVECIVGNHEALLLEAAQAEDWKNRYWDAACFQSFGIQAPSHIPKEYLKWIAQLPVYLDIGDYLLVHAGFNFKADNPLADERSMIWIRNWYHQIDMEWLNGRVIVHGHTPTSYLKIQSKVLQLAIAPALDIDAGCVFPYEHLNHLCVFNLDSRELVFQHNVEG
ncbi:MAG: metallophosphoesterase family protein [Bacteroidota bacterium]